MASDAQILAMDPVDAMNRFCRQRAPLPSVAYGKCGVVRRDRLVTSPNMDYVPEIMWDSVSDVYLRTDMRFGFDDATNWVQWHRADLPHLPAIPRRPSEHAPPDSQRLACMWWQPSDKNFTHNATNADRSAGKLAGGRMRDIEALERELGREVEEIQAQIDSTSGAPTIVPGVGPALARMRHTYAALTSLASGFDEKKLELAEFQRSWLELRGMANYYNWKKTRFDRGQRVGPATPEWCVGAYVENVQMATQYWVMGVPVWLVRDKLAAFRSGCHVERPTTMSFRPDDIGESFSVERAPLFDKVTSANPRSAQHHYAQQDFARVRPSTMLRTPSGPVVAVMPSAQAQNRGALATTLVSVADLRAQKAPPTPAMPAASSSRAAGPSRTAKQAVTSRSAPYINPAAMRKLRGPKTGPKPHQKKTYVEKETARTPPVIPAWALAIERLDTRIPAGDQQAALFTFPPPSIFASESPSPERLLTYLYSWLKTREGWLKRMRPSSELPVALKMSTWRELLYFRFGCPQPREKRFRSAEKMQDELQQFDISLRFADAAIVFGNGECLCGAVSRVTGPEDPYLVSYNERTHCIDTAAGEAAIDDMLIADCVWELHMLGFRFDLARVDAALNDSKEPNEAREKLLAQCWGTEDSDIVTIDWREENYGLASNTIEERLPYLRALYALSKTWRGIDFPAGISDLDQPDISPNTAEYLEERLVAAVVQRAFHCLHRPIITPRRAYQTTDL
ncbi:hypothetical protein HWV62_40278 [Athelia sp. TMB]|nr:hypothetical protein HWV62_40278 [Athelia sp. TMB]